VPISPRSEHSREPWTAILGLAFGIGTASCQALPPPARVDARFGVVRAGSPEEARGLAAALDQLLPRVIAEIPDARPATTPRGPEGTGLQVWLQEEPALYVFPSSSTYRDADGFFSDRLGRIHLRAGSDDVERTLVHELVHATLGASWQGLPGSLEEGLCDVVAARLCPQSAPRLRAGRLLAAALAIGGLELEVRFGAPLHPPDPAADVCFVQRILPAGRSAANLDPLDVFRTRAGISSVSLESDRKKALYGLAFLVTERIVERRGIEGLHEIVRRVGTGEDEETWLRAADLTRDPEDWRRALASALGPAELAELAREHPGLLLAPAPPPTALPVAAADGEPGGPILDDPFQPLRP
jgi:hypothetical protein